MTRLIRGDIRAHIVPAQDIDLQGDTGEPLQLLSDVEVEIAVLTLLNPIRPRAAQAGNNGGLLVSQLPDINNIIGTFGNVWNAVLTGAAVLGPTIDIQGCQFVSVMVQVNAACTIALAQSPDGINWVLGPTVVFAGAGTGVINAQVGCRFVTLQSTANVTATGTIQAKAA